ncbi:hypothetical protein CYMTET_30957 [Cymbomonas tetramitiformis]|uniref:Uncharacterized protein n=1 Tax=Cymbomonas tetramitiformis TaxID=36881 RepID=A0AAE0KTD9_9CHLO|nr:hypothetical protein CYMTET_30957 [Cymbomonas tetramitiformis]
MSDSTATPVRKELESLQQQLESSPFFKSFFSPSFDSQTCSEFPDGGIRAASPEPFKDFGDSSLTSPMNESPSKQKSLQTEAPYSREHRAHILDLERVVKRTREHSMLYQQFADVVQVLAKQMAAASQASEESLLQISSVNGEPHPDGPEARVLLNESRAALRDWQQVLANADRTHLELERYRASQKNWGAFWAPS